MVKWLIKPTPSHEQPRADHLDGHVSRHAGPLSTAVLFPVLARLADPRDLLRAALACKWWAAAAAPGLLEARLKTAVVRAHGLHAHGLWGFRV